MQFDGSETEIALPNPRGRVHFETADHVGARLEGVRTKISSELGHHRSEECVLAVMWHRMYIPSVPF